MALFLVKYGEISLKGANRRAFEDRLVQNILARLPRKMARPRRTWGRVFLEVDDACADAAAAVLETTFGVVAYAQAVSLRKETQAVAAAAAALAPQLQALAAAADGSLTFKVEASREDKRFALTSYDIACELGERLRTAVPALTVDVRRPQATVWVEVRDRIYVYLAQDRGLGGLPVGCSGRGMLLLSGGIDSPVAGYLMGGRGLAVDGVYFHSYPYTSAEAEDKVHQLAERLSRFLPRLILHVVPFTELQLRIKERAPEEEGTLLMRACMMAVASLLAAQRRCSCLITGESLGQVASQTVESLHVTGSHATLPVLRPLIGSSKEDIIRLARRIGTFETSILPHPDCCTLFAPRHPVIRPVFERLERSYARLQADDLVAAAADAAHRTRYGAEPLAVGNGQGLTAAR